MFTGIIEGMGHISALRTTDKGTRMTIEAGFSLKDVSLGDSIAVNGACLTAAHIEHSRFAADLSPESMTTTTFGNARPGDKVNLERALRLSDRLDGHLVSGHVDGTGTLRSRTRSGNAILVRIEAPEHIIRYMIHKGSVAVDGVSLTINQITADAFDVSIIPHTASLTTVGLKQPGERVNIETDLIGKYVERFIKPRDRATAHSERKGIDLDFLTRTGFM
ncbi:MAG: riboflavin synthase [Desulfobacterales bacterium]|jgi:riboflavin synthase